MKKMIVAGLLLSLPVVFGGFPNAAAMLGVSATAAGKVIDAIMIGMSIWAILGLVLVSGGALAAVIASARALIVRIGKKATIAW